VQTDVLERRTVSVEHADYVLQAVDTHRSGEARAFLGRTRRPLGPVGKMGKNGDALLKEFREKWKMVTLYSRNF
jgi:hypothetical protein